MKIERSRRCLLFLVAAGVAAVGAVASPRANQESMRLSITAPGNIILVTNTNDSGPGSLRDALAIANDGDTIDATGVSGTILLTSGELGIGHNVTINGPGAGTLVVNGNGSSSVFANGDPDATISGFTITNGFAGILNIGNLTVSNCTISGNLGGGGIQNTGPQNIGGGGMLTVTNCTISGNSADYGGGIYNFWGVTISNSTLSGNLADVDGGGVYNSREDQFHSAVVSIENSTVSGNSATGNGGGIYNDFGQVLLPIPP